MTTKRVQFVEKKGKFDQYGNEDLKFLEVESVERTLKDWYGFAEHEDGFTQRIIDWFFEETDDTLSSRAKKIVDYVNERSGSDWISVTIEEWLILEHTRWLLIAGERDRQHCRELEGKIRELERK